MAALAIRHTRSFLLPGFQIPFSRSLIVATSAPTVTLSSSAFNWSIPSLQSLFELFPPFLLAVPKKKTSHSRKAMRSANKGLKDKQNIVHCPGCGSPKLAHHLCSNCYSFLTRLWKGKSKAGGDGPMPDLS